MYRSTALVCSWLLGLGLEAVLTPLLPPAWAPLTAPGPTALVIPFFTPFFLRIPVTTGSRSDSVDSVGSVTRPPGWVRCRCRASPCVTCWGCSWD